MKANIIPLIKKGTVIFTIEDCKIEEYFVIGIEIEKVSDGFIKDISNYITLKLDRYNDDINSYQQKKKLSLCFLTKEELINNLKQ